MSTRSLLPALALGVGVLGCASSSDSVTAPAGVGSGTVPRVEINVQVAHPSVKPYNLFIGEGADVDFVFTIPAGTECGVRFEPRGAMAPRNIAVDAGNRTVRRRFLVADFNERIWYTVRCLTRDRVSEEQAGIYVW